MFGLAQIEDAPGLRDIKAWFRSPGRMLWNSMNRLIAVGDATFNLDRTTQEPAAPLPQVPVISGGRYSR